jgi:hypothetical protein
LNNCGKCNCLTDEMKGRRTLIIVGGEKNAK